MSTKTEICNMAISHIAVAKPIADITTDRSNEATVCNRFYVNVRDRILTDFEWPFATKFATLQLVEEDPTDEWGYSYTYPTDCLMARRIPSGLRNTYPGNDIAFRVVYDELIYTNLEDADLEYTVRITNDASFRPDFVSALSLRLAIEIAPRVTAGDTSTLVTNLYQRYELEISRAAANAMNGQVRDLPPDAEMHRARD